MDWKVGNRMNGDIQRIIKNPRYRILIIGGEQFIVDMWGSIWKIVFPFFFWMLPNSVFKVEDPTIVKKLVTLEVKQSKIGTTIAWFVVGISIFLANLLEPLMDKFNFQSAAIFRLIIIVIAIIIALSLFFYMAQRCKTRLNSMVNLERLPRRKLWIRPKTFKHFFQVLFFYFFTLSFTLFAFAASFDTPNVIALLVATIFLFLFLTISAMTVMGDSVKVKFKGKKDTAV
jgi:uncharacterized membrane protein (TIGR01218 family)